MKLLPLLTLAASLQSGFTATANASISSNQSAVVLEPGDSVSSTLTRKAWAAFEAGNLGAVLAYTGRCRELFQDEALAQQASLIGPVASTDLERVRAQYALNDVGTCLFILGQALERAGNLQEALSAYELLIHRFSYAQCWDNNGWYWFPADSARARVRIIENYVPRM